MHLTSTLIYLVGASGSGKDSLLAHARSRLCAQQEVIFAHRYITRAASAGGENHIALSKMEFEMRRQAGLMAMHWESHGYCYGVGIEINHWLAKGMTVVVNGSREYLPAATEMYPELRPIWIEVDPETLRARLAAADCAGDVEFLPNVSREEKVRFLRSLDVFSVPATASEAFGLYVIEAMAAGVPVVQPRAWAFPEIVGERAGVLFDPGKNEDGTALALADALEEILRDPARLRACGAAAQELAREKFSLRGMASSFAQLAASLGAQAVKNSFP